MRELTEEKKRMLKSMGLHYCKYYNNIVRFNPSFCGKCRHCTRPTK
jgi:hypothetical protein